MSYLRNELYFTLKNKERTILTTYTDEHKLIWKQLIVKYPKFEWQRYKQVDSKWFEFCGVYVHNGQIENINDLYLKLPDVKNFIWILMSGCTNYGPESKVESL
jgi:hypothetical protein